MDQRQHHSFLNFCLLLSWKTPCFAENILMLTTNSVASPSHYMALSAITGGLTSSGHNVTLVTNDMKGTTGFPNGTYNNVLYFKASYRQEDIYKFMEKAMVDMAFDNLGFIESMKEFNNILKLTYSSCLDLWKDKGLVNHLKTLNFDFALAFPFSDCDVLMAHHLGVPFAVVFPSVRAPPFHEGFIGMPYPSAYVPFDVFSLFTDEMTFFERLQNFVMPVVWHIMQHMSNSQYYDIQVEFDIHPDKSIKELYSKASLFLSHVSPGNDFPRPVTPNFVPIGGLISKPSKPLSKELEEFVQGSGDHGVIVFTLGSAIKGLHRSDTAEVVARVFSKLPQRVLWRNDAPPPSSLGNNTKLLKWLPQNDLLGHPKTRLLIYHGGSNGVLESIYHGVPMVIIPLFGDQFSHAARIQKKGMGLMLGKTDITEEKLMAVIQEVIKNPSYRKRAQHFSKILHDNPMTPLERAVYWIEHVMKFGDEHLRPRSADMSFIELYMIDVVVFLFVVFIIGLYIDFLILRKCFRVCCGTSLQKSKRE